jgi:branched-chain amino acid transport system permease protein
MLIQVFEQVLNGLLAGAYYLLIALGLTLMGLVNLAHGAFYALGAYFAVKLADTFGFAGALVLSPLAVALVGLVVERFLFRRFYREDPALGLLLTFGLAMVAEQALRWIFGASPIPFSIPPELKGQVLVGDFIYSKYRLLMLAVAVMVVAGLWLLLRRTPRTGPGEGVKTVADAALGISLAPYMASVVCWRCTGRAGRRAAGMISGVHPAMAPTSDRFLSSSS